jgi:hypothetical protein
MKLSKRSFSSKNFISNPHFFPKRHLAIVFLHILAITVIIHHHHHHHHHAHHHVVMVMLHIVGDYTSPLKKYRVRIQIFKKTKKQLKTSKQKYKPTRPLTPL